MTGSAQFQAGNFGGTGKARVLWFDSVAEARAQPNLFAIADAVQIKNGGVFFASPTDATTVDDGVNAFAVNGVAVGRFIYGSGLNVNGTPSNAVLGDSFIISNASGVPNIQTKLALQSVELDDFLHSDLRQHYRADTRYISLSANVVTELRDRVGASKLTQATAGNRPAYVSSEPGFGGRPCVDFGNVNLHSKLLFTTANRTVDREFTRFVVFKPNIDMSAGNGRIIGNGDNNRLCEISIEPAQSSISMYNGSGQPFADYDKTSLLAHFAMVSFCGALNLRSGGTVYRSDGLITHGEEINSATSTNSGTFAIGGAFFAAVGAPIKIAEAGEIFGIPSAHARGMILEYISKRYGFSLPAREVMFGGNSLYVKATNWPVTMVLANTKSRYFTALGGITTAQVVDCLQSDIYNQTCGLVNIRRAWVGSEISNSLVVNLTGPQIIAEIIALVNEAKRSGVTDVVFGTCTPRGGLTAPQEAVRVYVNNWLANNWQSMGITKLVNLHTTDVIDGQSCPVELTTAVGNAVYYLDEGGAWVHNTPAGYALRSEQFRQRLAALGY